MLTPSATASSTAVSDSAHRSRSTTRSSPLSGSWRRSHRAQHACALRDPRGAACSRAFRTSRSRHGRSRDYPGSGVARTRSAAPVARVGGTPLRVPRPVGRTGGGTGVPASRSSSVSLAAAAPSPLCCRRPLDRHDDGLQRRWKAFRWPRGRGVHPGACSTCFASGGFRRTSSTTQLEHEVGPDQASAGSKTIATSPEHRRSTSMRIASRRRSARWRWRSAGSTTVALHGGVGAEGSSDVRARVCRLLELPWRRSTSSSCRSRGARDRARGSLQDG